MIRIHLSRLLGEKKWKQKKLAEMTGIRPTTIGEYYHEIIERVTLRHVEAICRALDCRIEELLEITDDKEPPPTTT